MVSTAEDTARVVAGHEIETCATCPSCGAGSDFHMITEVCLGEKRFTSQVLCNFCGLVFRRDRFTMGALQRWYAGMAASETVQEDWEKVTSSPLEEMRQVRYRRNLDWIEKERDDAGPGSVLDVACGPGTGLLPFLERGWSVTGIDVFSSRIEYAARKHGLHLIEGLFEDYDFGDQKFDVVIASHILEHVHQPLLFMQKIHDLLKEDGVAYVELPNILEYVTFRSAMYMAHNNDFSSLSLKNLMWAAGFEVAAEYGPQTKKDGVKHLGVILKKVSNPRPAVSPPGDCLESVLGRFLIGLDEDGRQRSSVQHIRFVVPDEKTVSHYCKPGWNAAAIHSVAGAEGGRLDVHIHRAPSKESPDKQQREPESQPVRLLRRVPFLYRPLRWIYRRFCR